MGPVADRSIGVLQGSQRSVRSPIFKMGLLLAVLVLTAVFQSGLRRDPQYWQRTVLHRSSVRLIAVVSLLLWLGIVFAERWIAYAIRWPTTSAPLSS